ncbi:ABC transporter permease subunit [Bythopirellula goksoeyrii]|uniref:ABC-2 family transporter protein n=1 Tax=Bythopirellula goksoeyrii TaxID=1400387 RepID=A0A5B9Q7I5_9BACT|nr:ABC transporter permease subunit [Bythopirellula goksoeyrii]QEG34957.1 ABC-2 family transporter protein [Bythopirellula goksoeyrii]
MIRGILRKTLYETWVLHLAFGLALFVVGMLLTMLLPQLEEGLNQFLSTLPFVRTFIQALLGDDFGGNINAETLRAIVWVHPTVLTLLWAQEIVFCTRLPAGEIDRGTIDILLSWPVSRIKLYVSETLVWLISGFWLCGMLLAGHNVASFFAPSQGGHALTKSLVVVGNLYCVYFAVGGVVLLISTLSNVRGRAMATAFGLVVASFLLNFLIQFWPEIDFLGTLGILSYYRPANILATGEVPVGDMLTLLAIGSIAWVVGLIVFRRRNICTL